LCMSLYLGDKYRDFVVLRGVISKHR